MVTTQFYPNARAALAFSGKRDVMQQSRSQNNAPDVPQADTFNSRPAHKAASAPKFGAIPRYKGPYNSVQVITDFQDQTSNARVYNRFRDVLQFVARQNELQQKSQLGRYLGKQSGKVSPQEAQQRHELKRNFQWDASPEWQSGKKGTLDHVDIADVSPFDITKASINLSELAQEPNKNVYVHVTDPGVGSGKKAHERSILVTRNHGVHVGPNNGTLGLLTEFLNKKGEPFKLYEIDLSKTNRLEQIRTGKADTGSTFHGRDVFAVAAGAIAGGIAPESLATEESVKTPLEPVVSDFAKGSQLPTAIGDSTNVWANRDNTGGNLVLNTALSQQEFDELFAQKAQFKLQTEEGQTLDVPVKKTFGQVGQGEPLIYLGSKHSADPSKRLLEVALNCGDVSQRLGLRNASQTAKLTITRQPALG